MWALQWWFKTTDNHHCVKVRERRNKCCVSYKKWTHVRLISTLSLTGELLMRLVLSHWMFGMMLVWLPADISYAGRGGALRTVSKVLFDEKMITGSAKRQMIGPQGGYQFSKDWNEDWYYFIQTNTRQECINITHCWHEIMWHFKNEGGLGLYKENLICLQKKQNRNRINIIMWRVRTDFCIWVGNSSLGDGGGVYFKHHSFGKRRY